MRIRISFSLWCGSRSVSGSRSGSYLSIRCGLVGTYFRNNCVRFQENGSHFRFNFHLLTYYGTQEPVLYLRWAFHHHCDATYCPPLWCLVACDLGIVTQHSPSTPLLLAIHNSLRAVLFPFCHSYKIRLKFTCHNFLQPQNLSSMTGERHFHLLGDSLIILSENRYIKKLF